MAQNSTIYYFSPDFNGAAGGVRVIYKHVDILNELGYSAFVLHSKPGFRCTWFENTTQVTYLKQVTITEKDYVVIPEIYFHLIDDTELTFRNKLRHWVGHKLDYFTARNLWLSAGKKVVFNQNAYHTFLNYGFDKKIGTDFLSRIHGYFSISEQNKKYLQFAFPNFEIIRVQWSMNSSIYSFEPEKKKKLISYMPRKNTEHAQQVIHLLQSRNSLEGFELKAIEGMNQVEVAQTLKQSSFFLSFGYPEGLPLPPAEAMACGCIVIGYHGGGGEEYFKSEFSYSVNFGDIVSFAEKVEDILTQFRNDNSSFSDKMKMASSFILSTYSETNEKLVLQSAWEKLIR